MIWLESMDSDGFAVIPGVFGQKSVRTLLDDMERVPLQRSRAGVRHALRYAPVAAVARSPQLLGIARDVLGNDAFPFRATLFEKSQQANWLVVWHQDTALPLRERKETPGWGPWSVKDGVTYAHAPADALARILTLRLHLDDSSATNGPLRVLPATHRLGVLEDEAIRELASQIPAVDCEVACGDVLAMRPLLVHASSKSQSDAPRRVLHIEYAALADLGDGLELQVA